MCLYVDGWVGGCVSVQDGLGPLTVMLTKEIEYFDKMHKFWKWKNDYADYDDFNTGTITFTPIVNKGRYFMVAWGVDDDAPVAKSKKFDFPCSRIFSVLII